MDLDRLFDNWAHDNFPEDVYDVTSTSKEERDRKLQVWDLARQAYTEAYEAGYDEGSNDGYSEGYDDGHADGYAEGESGE